MSHVLIYDSPDLYSRGAGFKNVAAEGESLIEIAETFGRRKSTQSLELFAGPGFNSKYLASKGFEAHCVDSNVNMKRFALSSSGDLAAYHLADVTEFKIGKKFDLIFSLWDSVAYLLKNEDFVAHLRNVSSHLLPGGIYVIEMGHPKCYFSKEGWISEHVDRSKDGDLMMVWGDASDHLDPINMIVKCTVTIDAKVRGEVVKLSESALQRIYLYNEIKLLVEKVKGLEIVHWYGGLSPLCDFDMSPQSWRMIPVIRKCR